MIAGVAVLVGILIGVAVVGLTGRRTPGDDVLVRAGRLRSWTLGLGLIGLVAVAVPLIASRMTTDTFWTPVNPALVSIAAGVAAVIVGGTLLARGRRTASACLVLVPGALAVGFWVLFLVGEIVFPH
jgi:hypothetical protein